ncbi:hypothetical protein B0H66DRAFT_643313 [Apodospora peruviana]|uniref:Uncharacterized protein n=1 Tax=Apodospora peruviana TaxID=516989 RepID=A0AAE0HXK2_9PEZI|nr:hypothetical protein B0H66DRAFT_643313 [Apodospora peruviana]
MDSPRSPKRRRILASINRDRDVNGDADDNYRPRSRKSHPETSDPAPDRTSHDTPVRGPSASIDDTEDRGHRDQRHGSEPKATRFRFKSSRRRHRSPREDGDRPRRCRDPDDGKDVEGSERRRRGRSRSQSPRHRHRHHPGRRRHHHHHKSTTEQPPPPEESVDPFAPDPLDPETAFRESLFDAMADDEGAAYWEGVYGQPIHVYSAEKPTAGGKLERMTDDEYAAHVRQKMWEKTHAGLLEERARRQRQAEEDNRKTEEGRQIAAEMERSLRRGEQRRKRRVWKELWDDYVKAWAGWEGETMDIPWPVSVGDGVEASGEERGKVMAEMVKAFFVNGLRLEEISEKEFAARLKEERVRWHPDKMQQRLGGKVEEGVMRDVTAIFQAIDALWNDTRKSL